MRACLLALLMLFCLPLQWAGAATGAPCAHEPCAPLHASLTEASAQAAADEAVGESHAQHPHCGSCHTGAMALSASAPWAVGDTARGLRSGPKPWTEVMLIERPERPQWLTLA
ncbi:MAG: hypothetical protein KF871_15460 [Hydrogenophaga sp.]|uniref:hypothetical protein n=1 Tax=Hydrogenophaga sp. TaxID=1904254 RepID=UPI001D4BF80E|nr:hypothetical protein [Hydrogenophaga sp.]MBX3611289.1 hypothetical protein [Hydrogenophaga sp.]